MINNIYIIILLIVGVIGGTAVVINDSSEITGEYQSESGSVLLLNSDGRFTVTQDNSFSGDYTYDQNTVTLIYTYGSFVMARDGKDLIDQDSEPWVKK